MRLRFCNPSGATAFRVTVEGHRMEVTHADGRPVEPVPVDQLTIGMGERYDVVVLADRPGALADRRRSGGVSCGGGRRCVAIRWDRGKEVLHQLSRAVGRTGASPDRPVRTGDRPAGATGPDANARPLRRSKTVCGRSTARLTPNAEILSIVQGEVVRVVLVNHSMMLHPMHLHGHFFRTGDVLKDTLIVPAHMGRAEFVFLADNPGRWFFHCHIAYHLEAGMAREIRYIG
ncbi:MAG: hypothetical protein KatS3mg115_0501 [Candidatus Poribacteria bacterium]|nr:MAG: hypothetical protein KatS3mg115_0501 [Candidatus Poribacteria bacterium]